MAAEAAVYAARITPNATVCVQAGGSLTIDDGYFHANAPGYDHWSGVLAAYSANDSDVLDPLRAKFAL